MTSSAATNRLAGTVKSSALVVLRFRTVWYLVGACTGSSGGEPAGENVVHEPEFPKPPNNQAIDVDFVPGVRNIGVARKPVMVVVQPFTGGDDRNHQLVGRAIIELEATVT